MTLLLLMECMRRTLTMHSMEQCGWTWKLTQALIVDGVVQIIQGTAISCQNLWPTFRIKERRLEFMLPNTSGKLYLVHLPHVPSLRHYHFGMHIMTTVHHFQIILNILLVDGLHQPSNSIMVIKQFAMLM